MPIYEYRCQKCERVFEKIQKVGEGRELLKCPYCGAKQLERVLSTFSSMSSGSPSCGPAGGSTGFT